MAAAGVKSRRRESAPGASPASPALAPAPPPRPRRASPSRRPGRRLREAAARRARRASRGGRPRAPSPRRRPRVPRPPPAPPSVPGSPRRCSMPASAAARRMNSHLRPTDSTRSTSEAGSAAARTRPGNPAPEPISAIRRALRRSSISRPERLSSTWTFQARSGSVTELTDARSTESSSRTLTRAARAAGSSSTAAAAARARAHSEVRRPRSDGARPLRCRSRPRRGP